MSSFFKIKEPQVETVNNGVKPLEVNDKFKVKETEDVKEIKPENLTNYRDVRLVNESDFVMDSTEKKGDVFEVRNDKSEYFDYEGVKVDKVEIEEYCIGYWTVGTKVKLLTDKNYLGMCKWIEDKNPGLDFRLVQLPEIIMLKLRVNNDKFLRDLPNDYNLLDYIDEIFESIKINNDIMHGVYSKIKDGTVKQKDLDLLAVELKVLEKAIKLDYTARGLSKSELICIMEDCVGKFAHTKLGDCVTDSLTLKDLTTNSYEDLTLIQCNDTIVEWIAEHIEMFGPLDISGNLDAIDELGRFDSSKYSEFASSLDVNKYKNNVLDLTPGTLNVVCRNNIGNPRLQLHCVATDCLKLMTSDEIRKEVRNLLKDKI